MAVVVSLLHTWTDRTGKGSKWYTDDLQQPGEHPCLLDNVELYLEAPKAGSDYPVSTMSFDVHNGGEDFVRHTHSQVKLYYNSEGKRWLQAIMYVTSATAETVRHPGKNGIEKTYNTHVECQDIVGEMERYQSDGVVTYDGVRTALGGAASVVVGTISHSDGLHAVLVRGCGEQYLAGGGKSTKCQGYIQPGNTRKALSTLCSHAKIRMMIDSGNPMLMGSYDSTPDLMRWFSVPADYVVDERGINSALVESWNNRPIVVQDRQDIYVPGDKTDDEVYSEVIQAGAVSGTPYTYKTATKIASKVRFPAVDPLTLSAAVIDPWGNKVPNAVRIVDKSSCWAVLEIDIAKTTIDESNTGGGDKPGGGEDPLDPLPTDPTDPAVPEEGGTGGDTGGGTGKDPKPDPGKPEEKPDKPVKGNYEVKVYARKILSAYAALHFVPCDYKDAGDTYTVDTDRIDFSAGDGGSWVLPNYEAAPAEIDICFRGWKDFCDICDTGYQKGGAPSHGEGPAVPLRYGPPIQPLDRWYTGRDGDFLSGCAVQSVSYSYGAHKVFGAIKLVKVAAA